MAHTIVRDVVIWTKHVHGGDVASRLSALPGEAEVTLIVDGVRGQWCKMRDGKDGRSTSGVRPVGRAQAFWQSLFESRKGESVTVEFGGPDESGAGSNGPGGAPLAGGLQRTPAQRAAALSAFLSVTGRGWRADGPPMTRDEMNER